MHFAPSELVALIVAASFAAGLNTYATIATLGVLSRLNWVHLPPGLHALGDTWVIVVAVALFGAEFFADKIPALDVLWNAAHTFVRVPAAALLAFKATSSLTPTHQLLATAAGAGIAALAHTSKTAARVIVTPSPEPVSNIALSTAEDGAAIGLTWLATHHPYTAAGIAGVLIVFLLLSLRLLWRGVQRVSGAVKGRFRSLNGRSAAEQA